MRVWRLARKRRLPDTFSGEGARLAGGRWNRPGIRVVYTSESLALAMLEYLVRAAPGRAPRDVWSTWADIPNELAIETLPVRSLPREWRRFSPPVEALRELGDAWIKRGKTAVMKVPSAVVPFECNYLLNPSHLDFAKVRIGRSQLVTFDPRLLP